MNPAIQAPPHFEEVLPPRNVAWEKFEDSIWIYVTGNTGERVHLVFDQKTLRRFADAMKQAADEMDVYMRERAGGKP